MSAKFDPIRLRVQHRSRLFDRSLVGRTDRQTDDEVGRQPHCLLASSGE